MAILSLKTSEEGNKPIQQNLQQGPNKNKGLMLFLLGILVVCIAGTVYLSFQKSAIALEQSDLDNQVINLEKEVQTLKVNNVEANEAANNALKEMEKNELKWSTIISAVQDLIPFDSASKKPKVNFLSYSGSADGKLALSGVTREGSLPPFADVSELLAKFNSSNFFKDAYIPSISKGISESGGITLSFVFNVTYQEPTLENAQKLNLQDVNNSASSTAVDNSQNTAEKTPRVPKK